MAQSKSTRSRLWLLLRYIPRGPRKIDVNRLHEIATKRRHAVDVRTIQRDLNKLSTDFPIRSDNGRPQGWWWEKDAPSSNLTGMDPTTAMAFLLLESQIQGMVPPSTERFLRPMFQHAARIAQKLDEGKAARFVPRLIAEPDRLGRPPPELDQTVQEVVTEALYHERQLEVVYHPPDKPPRTHQINALGLIGRAPDLRLLVSRAAGGSPFQMLVQRISTATLLDSPTDFAEGFDLPGWVRTRTTSYAYSDEPIPIVLAVRPEVIGAFRSRKLSEDQRIDKGDPWFRVRATVMDTASLRSWLLGFEGKVVVRGPESLVEGMRSAVQGLMEGYGLDGGDPEG